jgi:hypothetical protein
VGALTGRGGEGGGVGAGVGAVLVNLASCITCRGVAPVEYPEEGEVMESERGEKPSNTSLDQLPPPSVECQ